MYGLDMDFLADLGLGDMINDHIQENTKERKDSKENITFEDMRQQYDIDGQKSAVGRLRGACKTYKDVN